jgi:Tfp pilus assembly protein PilX
MKKFLQQVKKIKTSKGFVILFAVIISTIIMLISFGIFTVATKSTLLSANSKEVLIAFYAADSGMECSLHMIKSGVLTTTGATNPVCGSGVYAASSNFPTSALTRPISSHQFIVTYADGGCSHVEINQTLSPNTTSGGAAMYITKIYSRGFNRCNITSGTVGGTPAGYPFTADPRLLERVLEVEFETP